MATLANALKEEISRLARKEVRQQVAGPVKSVTQFERDIAALKSQVQDLRHTLSALSTPDASGQTVNKKAAGKKTASKKTASKKTASKKAAAKKQGGAEKAGGAEPASGTRSARAQFSPDALKASRQRLGLSADNYGKLIGVSGLSIYNWEGGKAKPRESSIAALASIKGIGKREAVRRLEALAEAKASEKQAAKEGRPAGEGQAADKG